MWLRCKRTCFLKRKFKATNIHLRKVRLETTSRSQALVLNWGGLSICFEATRKSSKELMFQTEEADHGLFKKMYESHRAIALLDIIV
jgi:hypothetical protein